MHNTLWKPFILFTSVLWQSALGSKTCSWICNGESNQPSIESHASSLIAMPRTSACSDSRWHVLLIYGSAYKFQRFQTIISGYAMLTIKNLHDHMQMQSTLLNWVAHEGLRSWCLLKFMFRATTFATLNHTFTSQNINFIYWFLNIFWVPMHPSKR